MADHLYIDKDDTNTNISDDDDNDDILLLLLIIIITCYSFECVSANVFAWVCMLHIHVYMCMYACMSVGSMTCGFSPLTPLNFPVNNARECNFTTKRHEEQNHTVM